MRGPIAWNGRVVAATSFYGLLTLTLGFLSALGALVVYRMPLFEACRSLWEVLWASHSAYGFWIPALVAGGSLALIGGSLLWQWLATQRLLRRIAVQRVAIPPRLARLAEDIGLQDRVDCVTGMPITPFCYGFLRPRVCIPLELLDLLDDGELVAVLRHEAHHVLHREPLKIWLSRGLSQGLFFLPLARDLRDSYLTAKEIAADEVTVADDGSELPLASALIKLLSLDGRETLDSTAVIGGLLSMPVALLVRSNGGNMGNITEARIRRLLDHQPVRLRWPSFASILFSALVVGAIFTVSYTGLAAAPSTLYDECTSQTIELSTVPELQSVGPLVVPAPSGRSTFTVAPLPVWEPVEMWSDGRERCDEAVKLDCPRLALDLGR